MPDAHVIEAMLLRWNEGPAGRTVTFLLPEDTTQHPFRGLKCGPAHGQRLALSVALISDDESQTPHELAAQAPAEPADGQNGNGVDKHRLSRQAAMCCQDARFRRYLGEAHTGHSPETAPIAAAFVRDYCRVRSRSEFDTDPVAASLWNELHGRYTAWLHAPEVSG